MFFLYRINKYILFNMNEIERIKQELDNISGDKGSISDGYHTFDELYEYRLLYNAVWFNELAKTSHIRVGKSKRHSDNTIPFNDENWFIVWAQLPTGLITNHYEMKDWDLFKVPEFAIADKYDGHTPKDVAERIKQYIING